MFDDFPSGDAVLLVDADVHRETTIAGNELDDGHLGFTNDSNFIG